MLTAAYWQEVQTETPREQWRRRYQQRRCLACGARELQNRGCSNFCAQHFRSHRWCAACETVRTKAEHGGSRFCRACASAWNRAHYDAHPEASLYYMRLKRMAERTHTREQTIFAEVRRRIALAAFVRATPGLTWRQRGRLVGRHGESMAENYRKQCRGDVRDPDHAELSRTHRRKR